MRDIVPREFQKVYLHLSSIKGVIVEPGEYNGGGHNRKNTCVDLSEVSYDPRGRRLTIEATAKRSTQRFDLVIVSRKAEDLKMVREYFQV